MTNPKHTPGPWIAMEDGEGSDNWLIVPERYRYTLAHVNFQNNDKANAYLIAAAPDLLEALKLVAHMDVNGHELIDRLSFSTPGREIQDRILKAIAKAEGKGE